VLFGAGIKSLLAQILTFELNRNSLLIVVILCMYGWMDGLLLLCNDLD